MILFLVLKEQLIAEYITSKVGLYIIYSFESYM